MPELSKLAHSFVNMQNDGGNAFEDVFNKEFATKSNFNQLDIPIFFQSFFVSFSSMFLVGLPNKIFKVRNMHVSLHNKELNGIDTSSMVFDKFKFSNRTIYEFCRR